MTLAPHEVPAAYLHALFAEEPLRRYVVTSSQDEQAATINTRIEQLVQLKARGPHSYSREELVEMLDAALGATDDDSAD